LSGGMYVWALAGAQVMCSAAGRKAKGHGTTVLGDLTLRETELLQLLATEGLTNRGLGERLGIAPATVGTHLAHARIKLRVHNRVQLALATYRLGIARA
jgi:DNA-binding CsgD family transcriptional regulator